MTCFFFYGKIYLCYLQFEANSRQSKEKGRRWVQWHLYHSSWDKTQTEIFSRSFIHIGWKSSADPGSGFYPSRGVSWVGRIWRRVAGSRNRCIVVCGRQREGETRLHEREGRDEDRKHVNPTTLVSGMYHVIAPSPTMVRSLSLFSPRIFFFPFYRSRCPMFHPSMSLRRAIVYAASFQPAQLALAWRISPFVVASIDFKQSWYLIFIRQPIERRFVIKVRL